MSLIKSVKHFFYYFEWISPKIFGVIATLEENEAETKEKEEEKKGYGSKRKTAKEKKKAEAKKLREKRLEERKIIAKVEKLGLSFREVRELATLTKSLDVFNVAASYLIEASQLKLDKYLNYKLLIATIMKGRKTETVFRIAKMFKNAKLDEVEGYADFDKLIKYINISDEKLLEATYAMVEAKNAGYPLKQKEIIKFYDANKPFSEDIYAFGEAMMFAQKNNLGITAKDLTLAIINHREPFQFVTNYYKIEKHGLTIPKDFFCKTPTSQQTMTEMIDLYISAREHGIDWDIKTILKDYKINKDLKNLLKYLIRFKYEGIDEVDYKRLFYYEELGGNIKSLLSAYLVSKAKNLGFDDLYSVLTKILSSLDETRDKTKINALNIVKAIDLGESAYGLTRKVIIKDYMLGNDVLSLLFSMNYGKQNGVEVPYSIAKLINKHYEGGVEAAIQKSLNPHTISGEPLKVTTKDNIEIVVTLNIVVLLNINNIFKGSGEQVLIDRANSIFIEEVQNRYNHDEIIKNINVISEIIILRLKGKMKADVRENITIHKEENHGHSTHTENKDHHHKAEEHEKTAHFHINYDKENEIQAKFNTVSKFIPTKVIIPKIDFVKETFKEIEKAKEEFEIHKHKAEAEIKKLEAEIKIKEAWAKEGNLKYYFLKPEDADNGGPNEH